jgi:hypothetical protein
VAEELIINRLNHSSLKVGDRCLEVGDKCPEVGDRYLRL